MAAPAHVPHRSPEESQVYRSPPWRQREWVPVRPADLSGRQPIGPRLGYPGPDQGFVYVLAERFRGQVHLQRNEHQDDALAGACAVALKRASLFGRAPVVYDLRVALTIWGFLQEEPDIELVRLRRPLFHECRHAHHYMQLRRIADLVPIAALRRPTDEILAAAAADWRAMFNLRRPG
jgi:hypothetical protein